jgi:hypothetical protein
MGGLAGKIVAKVWTFASSSGSKTYETLKYTDGTTSCNCMGWTRRVAADGSRSCKHTRYVHQGMADSECVSSHDYENNSPAPKKEYFEAKKTATKKKAKAKKSKAGASPVARKIDW